MLLTIKKNQLTVFNLRYCLILVGNFNDLIIFRIYTYMLELWITPMNECFDTTVLKALFF